VDFRPADYPGFDGLKKLAIVWQSGKRNDDLLAFAKMMRDHNKEVFLLAYLPIKRKDLETIPPFDHFVKSELNWYGRPGGEVVKTFLARHYGVGICLGAEEGSPLEFVARQLTADFKVGNTENPKLDFDLLIQSGQEKSTESVLKEVNYYLNFINKTPK